MIEDDAVVVENEPAGGEHWWAIKGEEILWLLHRVQAGEDAEMVYAEHYANSEHMFTEEDDAQNPDTSGPAARLSRVRRSRDEALGLVRKVFRVQVYRVRSWFSGRPSKD